MKDRRAQHQHQLEILAEELKGNTKRIKVKKKTISNLFRYEGRKLTNVREVDLRKFNKPLYLDTKHQTLEVQGLTTYEDIVDYTLPHGLLPTITPELKNITVGGVTVGIGIESNCYLYGFVHDGLLEADVLLPNGEIVTCNPHNKYKDLFYGLANSYGTLGYILRAKIKLHKVKPYVQLHTEQFNNTAKLIKAIKKATEDKTIEYVESLVYSSTEQYLTTSKPTNSTSNLKTIYGSSVFYKDVSRVGTFTLPTKEYIFRYDPDWFWNLPESSAFNQFRKLAPKSLRNSSFYTKYNAWRAKLKGNNVNDLDDPTLEKFIQDWEVPWEHAQELVDFGLKHVDMEWRPWLITVINTPGLATNYPMQPNKLYLNLGAYSFAKKQPGKPAYYNTKLMDDFCFSHGGIKMLYSSTFLTEKEFNKIYGGSSYSRLKRKYDPKKLFPTVFEKTVKAK